MPRPLQLADDASWKRRWRASPVIGQVAAGNPERGLVSSNRSGLYQLYAWNVPSGSLTQITNRPDGTVRGTLSDDGRWVIYLNDHKGDQTGHFVRIPFEGGDSQDLTPDLPPYFAYAGTLAHDGSVFGLVAPGSEGFDCYVVKLEGHEIGEPRLLYRSPTRAHGPVFSHDARIAVWQPAQEGKNALGLLAYDVETGRKLAELWDDDASVEMDSGAASPGDFWMVATTDQTGYKRPFLWNAETGERKGLDIGDLEGEVEGWGWSPDGKRILLCQTVRAEQRLYLHDLKAGTTRRLNAPAGTVGRAEFLPDGDIVAQWQDSTHPARPVLLDGETGEKKRDLLEPDPVPEGRPWRSITFPSTAGAEIQAWLAVPEGEGPYPTILHTHGGPTAAQFNVFSAESQAWLDHGFAFVSVNYRGSTSFGRDFERALWGDLGHWEVDDMAAAREYLVNQGIAQPDAFLLTGWSYGGYLTLHGLGTRPELWAGGIGGVVVADWVSQYEDESESLRGYDLALFGGSLEEKREQYLKSSPITYVQNLRSPLLIIQGRHDTTDPPRQVELYEARAKELGKDVRVEWFETGHGGSFVDRELGIRHHELALRFAYEALGLREDGTQAG
jgi:dipeptidyl aminopeptidase/acylaminoacyl peptidase